MGSRRSRSRVAVRGATSVAVRPTTAPVSRLQALPPWAQHVAALVLFGLALGAVFHEVAWRGLVFLAADYEAPSYFAAAGKRALAAGEYPLWNPYLFLGMPSYASLCFTPWVFPPAEVLAWLGRLPLTPPLVWLLVYYVLAGYGVFVLLRALGCGFWPAWLGGALFMLTPHLVSMGVFGHGSKLASVAFLPWLLWAALRLRHARRRLAWTALLALLVGLQLLRGHPQIGFYGLVMLALFAAVEILASLRQAAERRAALRFAAALGAALALGGALAAVLLLPVRGYAPDSIRGRAAGGGATYEFATGWSQSPGEVATFVLPAAFGFGEATYVGSMPFTNFPHYLGQGALLFGVCAGIFLRGRSLVFLGVLLLGSLLVSFGKHAPFVYDLLYAHLPYFNKFRVPVMILVLFQLGTSVAAGLGWAALRGEASAHVRWRRQPSLRGIAGGALVAAGVLLLGGLARSGSIADKVAGSERLPAAARAPYANVARRLLRDDAVRVAVLLALHAAVVAAVLRRRLPADMTGALVALLAVLDLSVVDRRMVHPERTWPGLASRVGPAPEEAGASGLAKFLGMAQQDAPAPARILPLGELFTSNEWMSQGVASVGGYHPAKPARVQALFEAEGLLTSPPVLDMLCVRYVVTPQRLQGWPEPAYAGPEGFAYAQQGNLPRAWLVGAARSLPSQDCVAALRQLDPRREVLLENALDLQLDAQVQGEASVRTFTANRIEIEVQASGPALLVLSEAYHPNWRARVNGAAKPVQPANCLLRAVAVPAGKSAVVFEYVDPALRAGLVSTGSAAALVVLLLLLGLVQRRRVVS